MSITHAPDGYTVILTGVSTLVLNPLVYAKVPYDTQKDFAPVTIVAAMPQIIERSFGTLRTVIANQKLHLFFHDVFLRT